MSRAKTWIAILALGHLTACSSTLTQLSPTQPAGSPTGRAGPFLSSPFFVTVIGGLAVAGITAGYSYLKARNDTKLATDTARREKLTAVLSSTASDLPTYVSTMGSMKELKVWLDKYDENSSETFEKLGLHHNEVLREYLEFFKLSLKTRNSVAILTEVRSFFEDPGVCDLVNREEDAIQKIDDAKDVQSIKDAGKAEGKAFDSLLSAMAEEVRKPQRKGAQPCVRQVVPSP
jgi:hypothetical protein